MTSSFQTEKKNQEEYGSNHKNVHAATESKSPAKIQDLSKFESKENTRKMDSRIFEVSNVGQIQEQQKILREQNQNLSSVGPLQRSGFSVFSGGVGGYYGQGRLASKSPSRSPYESKSNSSIGRMPTKSLKFGSGAEQIEESKQRAENNALHTQSVIERSKTDLNSDKNQEKTIKMQIDRLQQLHGVLDSADHKNSQLQDQPMELAELNMKHAESPKKVALYTLQQDETLIDRHYDSIKQSPSKSKFGDVATTTEGTGNLKNEQSETKQSARQNVSARQSQQNIAKNHHNHESSTTMNAGQNQELSVAQGSQALRSLGMTPIITVSRERDFDQSDPRNTFAKADMFMRRDKYNETSMSQLQLNSKQMSSLLRSNSREQTPNYLQGRSSVLNTYSNHGGLSGLAQNNLKSNIIEIQDNSSNNGGPLANKLEKDLERELSLTPNVNKKPSYHVPNYPSNVSQLSGQYRQQSSISPTRSVIGLASLAGNPAKEKLEQALQERVSKGVEELYRAKKEARAKEQEYEKKIALQEQQIELLTIQVKETEQREAQQRSMYDKMFVALESGNGDYTNSAGRGKKPEEMFNSTQMSFGKEIEQMQKQLQDEMQARINELETLLKTNEQGYIYERQKIEGKLAALTKNSQVISKENQEIKLQNSNLQRQLDTKIQELKQSQQDVKASQAEIQQHKLKHQGEIEGLERDTQAKYEELKSVYRTAQSCKKDETAQQKMNNIKVDIEYLDRIHELERQIKQFNNNKEIQQETAQTQLANHEEVVASFQSQLQSFEMKVKSKKEKIRALQTEYSEKNRECERQRMKNEKMQEQLKEMGIQIEKVQERCMSIKRDKESTLERRLDQIQREQDLKHEQLQVGITAAENDKNSAFMQIQALELNLNNIRHQAGEASKCKESQKDEKSPATQRNDLHRNEEFTANISAIQCNNENCSWNQQCSPCLRSNALQIQNTSSQNLRPRSKSQNTRSQRRSVSSQYNTKTASHLSKSRHSIAHRVSQEKEDFVKRSTSDGSHAKSSQKLYHNEDQDSGNAQNSHHQDIQYLRNSQNFESYENQNNGIIEISIEDLQLFNRLKKMIDATQQMECIGCKKFIPTIQFYDHLIESNDGDVEEEKYGTQSQIQLNENEYIKISNNQQQFNQFCNESISDLNGIGTQNQQESQFEPNSRASRSRSAGRPVTVQQNHLNTQSQLIMTGQSLQADNGFTTKLLDQQSKYQNALTIINRYQSQISFLKQQHQEFQDVIQNQDNTITLMQQGTAYSLHEQEVQQILHLKDEKQKMQLTMDRLKLQLEQRKTQLALLEERKAENELELKKEKKFLLESFLKSREENKQLLEIQQQFMHFEQSNDQRQFIPNQQNYNDDQIINENEFDLQNYENNAEEQQMYDNNNSQQFVRDLELQSQVSSQNQNLNKTNYFQASNFANNMTQQNQMNSYVDQNYQMNPQAPQKKYKIKMVGSTQNTRGTNSQYLSASNISSSVNLKEGQNHQHIRIKEGSQSEYMAGREISSYKKQSNLQLKMRQDEETSLSQIEDQLDQQMYDQVQFGQDGSFGKEEDESSLCYLGGGNESRESLQMYNYGLRPQNNNQNSSFNRQMMNIRMQQQHSMKQPAMPNQAFQM